MAKQSWILKLSAEQSPLLTQTKNTKL